MEQNSTSLEARQLALLLEIGRDLCSSLNINEVLNRVMDRVIQATGAERGFVVLIDKQTGQFDVKVARNIDRLTIDKDDFQLSRSVMERVARDGVPVLTDNASSDPRFMTAQSVIMHALRSVMCVPLRVRDDTFGLIFTDNRIASAFHHQDLEFLNAIAYQAAIAIDNARQHESAREVVRALAAAIEAKDPYTGGHVDRVTALAAAIGAVMQFDDETMRNLEMASILHDVGKIGIEEAVLRKPAMLNHEERRVMEKHPFIGEAIVRPLQNLPHDVKASILHHQERWDGKGYPARLKGDQIPIYARVVAVSDTYDAMCSNRPYRAALPRQVAIDEIKKNSGTQFDPSVVSAFLKVMETWVDPPDI